MSAPYTHRCGARLDARTDWNGIAYTVEFHNGLTGQRLDYCPGCGAELAVALRDGELADDSGHHPRDRHPGEART